MKSKRCRTAGLHPFLLMRSAAPIFTSCILSTTLSAGFMRATSLMAILHSCAEGGVSSIRASPLNASRMPSSVMKSIGDRQRKLRLRRSHPSPHRPRGSSSLPSQNISYALHAEGRIFGCVVWCYDEQPTAGAVGSTAAGPSVSTSFFGTAITVAPYSNSSHKLNTIRGTSHCSLTAALRPFQGSFQSNSSDTSPQPQSVPSPRPDSIHSTFVVAFPRLQIRSSS